MDGHLDWMSITVNTLYSFFRLKNLSVNNLSDLNINLRIPYFCFTLTHTDITNTSLPKYRVTILSRVVIDLSRKSPVSDSQKNGGTHFPESHTVELSVVLGLTMHAVQATLVVHDVESFDPLLVFSRATN